MNENIRAVFPLIVLLVVIVFCIPVIYLWEANNLVGALAYLVFYVIIACVVERVMRKYGFDFPTRSGFRPSKYQNTLTPEGRVMVMVVSGSIFGIIISLVVREFTGLWDVIGLSRTSAPVSDPYFWVLFAILFVVGAVIGNTIRKTTQKA
ncbi:MAG: hypothetical protein LBE76_03330 [Nitrososphaerota archaeon]|jgi:membrane associated rhomboid family serine protease|nr:hypothetical protein [Nitrososphaerota archaeon]